MELLNAAPKRIVFSHVPKAAGTTMGRLLKKNLGSKFYSYYGLYDHYMLRAIDVERMLEFHPQLLGVSSHLLSLDLPWDSENFMICAVAFVREPIDRAQSLFFYQQKTSNNKGISGQVNSESFFQSILDKDSEAGYPFMNAQWNFLQGKRSSWQYDFLLTHIQSGRLVIAPMERFDDACILLEKIHPELLPDMAYPCRQNTTARTSVLPLEIQEALAEQNSRDFELYEWTQAVFDRQFENVLGPNPAPVREDFKKRCAAVAGDWIAEDSEKALNREERSYFEHLKKENRRLRSENALLRSARDNRFLELLPSPFLGVAGRLMGAVKSR
jgi:hypothetical protein